VRFLNRKVHVVKSYSRRVVIVALGCLGSQVSSHELTLLELLLVGKVIDELLEAAVVSEPPEGEAVLVDGDVALT